MALIFSYDTIFIQESVLGFIEGNPMLTLIIKVFGLIPFKARLTHETRIALIWLNSHIMIMGC